MKGVMVLATFRNSSGMADLKCVLPVHEPWDSPLAVIHEGVVAVEAYAEAVASRGQEFLGVTCRVLNLNEYLEEVEKQYKGREHEWFDFSFLVAHSSPFLGKGV